MSRPHYLHLTFDPPATDEQLAAARCVLLELDPDAPTGAITPDGTVEDEFGGEVDGEAFAAWRKPVGAARARGAIAEALDVVGLNGHGWLDVADMGAMRLRPPADLRRFTFGDCPEMRARIDAAEQAFEASRSYSMAMQELAAAAESGDSDRLEKAAANVRRTKGAL